MQLRTFRASSLPEALSLVRRELGPAAAVIHTREVARRGWRGLFPGAREIEVTASTDVAVPSRLPHRAASPPPSVASPAPPPPSPQRDDIQRQIQQLQSMVADLCRRAPGPGAASRDLPESLFHLYADLIDADLDEETARNLVEQVRPSDPRESPGQLKDRLARRLEEQLRIAGPIASAAGRQRLVALVGPTGVGKTTTIAKLAANFRLREKRSVGLITVDTYRIAAVEQLRTYAEIIDLPMQVVSTPREMREAVRRLADVDLILMDTAGRSPRDEVKIQELRAFLGEAEADEVHLVLSAVGSAASLSRTAEHFTKVGATSLLLTKLDEAIGLGNVLSLLRASRLPVSYLTTGQNVPDDIEPAQGQRLARLILGLENAS